MPETSRHLSRRRAAPLKRLCSPRTQNYCPPSLAVPMPTVLTHAVVPLAIGIALGKGAIPHRLVIAGVVASILPDFDVIGFRLNIAYADAFGHRGASHSLFAAVLLALAAMSCAGWLKAKRLTAFLFIGISAFSHGLLDTLTNGGHGIALWWPLSDGRIFSPWQVIEVSPLSLRRVFSTRGAEVLQSKVFWVWLPAITACATGIFLRRWTLAPVADTRK
jgi:inner membrane protein